MDKDNGSVAEPTLAERAITHLPPPPSDVTVRTMASDLQSLKETGGNRPRPKNITLTLSAKDEAERKAAGSTQSEKAAIRNTRSRKTTLIISSVGILVLLILGAYVWWRK